MILYLVRHGQAVNSREHPERPLSEKGSAEVKLVAEHVSKEQAPTIIRHSTKARAEQTAQIFADSWGVSDIEFMEGLKPNDSMGPAKDLIESCDAEALMLVGHLPFMEIFACELLDKHTASWSTSTILALKREDDGTWTYLWTASPESLR